MPLQCFASWSLVKWGLILVVLAKIQYLAAYIFSQDIECHLVRAGQEDLGIKRLNKKWPLAYTTSLGRQGVKSRQDSWSSMLQVGLSSDLQPFHISMLSDFKVLYFPLNYKDPSFNFSNMNQHMLTVIRKVSKTCRWIRFMI